MKWTRVENGVYTAGPYTIERAPYHRAVWSADGPGVSAGVGHETKADAQEAARRAMVARLADPEVVPVVGDAARITVPSEVAGRKDTRGHVTSIIDNGAKNGTDQQPIYCIRYNVGGSRRCLFRHEFEVIEP